MFYKALGEQVRMEASTSHQTAPYQSAHSWWAQEELLFYLFGFFFFPLKFLQRISLEERVVQLEKSLKTPAPRDPTSPF